ncbi:MAG: DUF3592 domain-containing protein [Acidobacteriota bacterium]
MKSRCEVLSTNRLTFREVRAALFRTKHGFFLLFGALFGGIPTVISVFFAIGMLNERAILRDGHPATATVKGKHISSDSDSTSYYVVYEFRAANGRTYGGQRSADNRTYYATDEGSRFTLYYSPEDPFDIAIPGHPAMPWWVLLFLSLFMVVGGTLAYFGVRGLRSKLRTFGSGLQATAKNLGVREDPSMRVNNRPCRSIEFSFNDFQGRSYTCRSSFLSDKMLASIEGMEEVPIVYLPDRPEEADLDLDRLAERGL